MERKPDMKLVTRERLRLIERFLWAAVLVALPVTSFRYLPFLGANTQVRPLSFIPAVPLLFLLILRCLQERRLILWNANFLPLGIFIIITVISSVVGLFYAPADLYSYAYSSRVLRAWLSFGVGLLFLGISIPMNREEQDLRFTLKWVYVGLIAEVAWSLVQFFEINIYHFSWLEEIQRTLFMAGLPPNNRISGFALEPSWLAAQVLTIYLAWPLAAVIKNKYWSKRHWPVFLIFAACVFLLIFTFSRSGILAVVAAIVLTLLISDWERIKLAWGWFLLPFQSDRSLVTRIIEVGLRAIVILALLAGLAGGVFILSQNQYFSQIWKSNQTNFVNYVVDIYAGPRLAYSWAGWSIFTEHPWTGVGLGAAGFYLFDALPDWSHFNISEIAQLLSPENNIFPNVKNLYIRLLAETGIVGFWSFISFYLLMLGRILKIIRSKNKESAFLAMASLFAWISIVILGFTQDSLAMPTVWVPLGILIGMTTSKD